MQIVLKKIYKKQSNIKNYQEEISKIALSSNVGKRIQSINSIETYGYGTSKDLICKKEKIKQLSLIKAKQECLSLIMSKMHAQKSKVS